MNSRILELIKNPEMIAEEDMKLLKQEMGGKPYMQSLRALQLLAVNRFDRENYQKVLSETAAYTTDKKILYQLINGKKPAPEFFENISAVTGTSSAADAVMEKKNEDAEQTRSEGKSEVTVESVPIESVLGKNHQSDQIPDELERLELSAEADTADEKEIVAAQSLTMPNPVSEKAEYNVPQGNQQPENLKEESPDTDYTSETIIDEDKIHSETEVVEDPSQISFHGTNDFLPEIAIKPAAELSFEAPKPPISRHDEEMRRLIEEVERKMKEKKSAAPVKIEPEEMTANSDISFAETMDFDVAPKTAEAVIAVKTEQHGELVAQNGAKHAASPAEINVTSPESDALGEKEEQKSAWKPMQFSGMTTDAAIAKPNPDLSAQISTTSTHTEIPQQAEQEPLVKENDGAAIPNKTKQEAPQDSNVPQFINTWQSWLKIDRSNPIVSEKDTTKKVADEKAHSSAPQTEKLVHSEVEKSSSIDKFIENEPRISQLKDENSYVVKEKNNDISHLMTETLANIYAEQKLYAKAIKGFELLAEKYPEKKAYFREKIKEVKEMRTNNNQQ